MKCKSCKKKFYSAFHKVPIALIAIIVPLSTALSSEYGLNNGISTRNVTRNESLQQPSSSTGGNLTQTTSSSSSSSSDRRHQGSQVTTESVFRIPHPSSVASNVSSSTTTVKPFSLVLHNNSPLIPHNFTTIITSTPAVTADEPPPTFNDSSSSTPLYKSRLKKKGLVFTLSLRPKQRIYKPQPSPSTISMVNSCPTSFSSTISDLTQASFGDGPSNNSNKYKNTTSSPNSKNSSNNKVLEKLKGKISAAMTSKTYSASLTRGTNYGMKNSPSLTDINMKSRLEKIFPKPTTSIKTTTLGPELVKASTSVFETSTPFNLGNTGTIFVSNVGGYLLHQSNSNKVSTDQKPEKSTPSSTLEKPTPTVSSSVPKDKTGNGTEFELGETRYAITADQIGGNRPTERPFHFTTTIPTSTTTKVSRNRISHQYIKPHSPHNHIYAPTQNPIHLAHNEEALSPEDVKHFHDAHSSFGSKVNGDTEQKTKSSNLPTPSAPTTTKLEDSATKPTLTFSRGSIRGRVRPVFPLDDIVADSPIISPRKQPESASSGREHSQIKANANSNSDAHLPFYKEPGGVFVPKYSENDPEPNEVVNARFKERPEAAGIKYAPQSPTEPQQRELAYDSQLRRPNPNSYGVPVNNQQQQHLTRIPVQQSPQYVTVTQQPVFLSPVPVQQMMHHHPQAYPVSPPPQPQYYQAAPQHHPQQPVYYNAPHQQQHIPIQNHGHQHPHQPLYNRGHVPGQQQGNYIQPLPPPPPAKANAVPVQDTHNIYNGHRPTAPARQYFYVEDEDRKDFHNPPPRYDPASDYFYGDPNPPKPPIQSPPKPSRAQKKPKPVQNVVVEENDEEDEEPEVVEEDREDRNNKKNRNRGKTNDKYDNDDYRENRPPPRPKPRKPPSRPQYNRNNEDHDTYPNENVGEYIRPQSAPQRGSPQENVGEFTRPEGSPRRPVDNIEADPDFFGLDNHFHGGGGGGDRRNRPLRPLQEDRRALRPSQRDNGPYFDHPNIDYPSRRGPAPSDFRAVEKDFNNLPPLDPIYTRTLLQYDQENQAPRSNGNFRPVQERERYPNQSQDEDDQDEEYERRAPRRNNNRHNNRNRPKQQQQNEDEEEESPDDDEEEPERRPAPARRKPSRDEEEEEEEEPEERPQKGSNRKQQEEEPEQEEEEEAEEETEEVPQRKKPANDDAQEEEEEEEEEEEQPANRRRGGREKEEKKPPPKKPEPEKPAGNLDDDISAIEREYGGAGGYDPFAVQQQQLAPDAQVHPAFRQQLQGKR